MPAVRVGGVVKRFGATCALDRVDLEVDEGEVWGLLGPNGAGKTTLLRILFGLVAADAGWVELFGRARDSGTSAALDGVAGFVEAPSFYPYLSGRANLELLAELDGTGSPARVDEALERVQLTGRGSDRVSGYSTGMKQRLGIAAALLRAPRLLLLDEPTAGLDPEGVRDMAAMVRDLAGQGVAILISSHQIGEIEAVCHGYTMLRSGRVVWSGSAAQLRAQAPASAYRLETSDDPVALELARRQPGISAALRPGGGLTLAVKTGALLDGYVLQLGGAGVAVRRLELTVTPLESLFFSLTSDRGADQPEISDPTGLLDRAGAGT
ncbi:MAG: ABC transporter ATP-binding protein [Solirubrobacterales bacterium]|nr:ABC transporter ATP-binding protein [Solirubrobacterales bacterium]